MIDASKLKSYNTVNVTNGGVVASGIVTAASGFVGDLTGNADTATILANTRTLSISGDGTGSATFNGSADSDISLTLADSGVSADIYGSETEIPILTVDSKGRITSATTTVVGSGLTVSGSVGSGTVDFLTQSLDITGGTNVNTDVSGTSVTVNLDDDVSLAGGLTIAGVTTALSDINLGAYRWRNWC